MLSAILTHPLDVVKTRIMTDPNPGTSKYATSNPLRGEPFKRESRFRILNSEIIK